MSKLPKSFYQRSAIEIAPDVLGKYLVCHAPQGKVSGMIIEAEAYPAFSDEVSHGNKRTRRTEIMYGEGGYAYIYLIYGIHHQFAAVVNKKNIPEVVFIRGVKPEEGVEIMKINFGSTVKKTSDLTKSPGNLCKSFGIDMSLYGNDLTSDVLYIEDRGVVVDPNQIRKAKRVGIDKRLQGSQHELRYFIEV